MEEKATMVTVGTFDGVHRGHIALLRRLVGDASARGLRPLVVTFDRHPLETIAPGRAPGLITPVAERDRRLRGWGADVVTLPFTEEVRRLTVAEWLARLRDDYGARSVLMGYDNSFGSDFRDMTPGGYRDAAARLGLELEFGAEVPGCSSSNVRRAMKRGDVGEAAAILGRPFTVTGEVVHGRGLGHTIGFPTANVETGVRQLLPAPGVYAAMASAGGVSCPAVVNIGSCPTVTDGRRLTVEAHLIGFDADIYGRRLSLAFADRLRDERRFDGLEALTGQISRDITYARLLLASRLKLGCG